MIELGALARHARSNGGYIMPPPILYTLGTSNRDPTEFIDLLRSNKITSVIDVRSKNGSRVPHFDESRFHRLSRLLEDRGIAYDASLHETLGGLHNGKMTLGNFRTFQKTPQYQAAIQELKLKVSQATGSTVIICCERDVDKCHRKFIGDTLKAEGWTIVHL